MFTLTNTLRCFIGFIQLHSFSVNRTPISCLRLTRSPPSLQERMKRPNLSRPCLVCGTCTLYIYTTSKPLLLACTSASPSLAPYPPPPTLHLYLPPLSLLPPTLFPLTKLALAPSIWSPFLQQPRTCSHLLSCWTALNISSDARAILALATSLSFNPSVRSELCLPPASAFFFKKRKTPSRSEAKRIADATNLQTTPSLSIRHPYQQTN